LFNALFLVFLLLYLFEVSDFSVSEIIQYIIVGYQGLVLGICLLLLIIGCFVLKIMTTVQSHESLDHQVMSYLHDNLSTEDSLTIMLIDENQSVEVLKDTYFKIRKLEKLFTH
jgi:hypothetical protein